MKPYQHQTHYELLEVSRDAGETELRTAHERLQALYAPDSVALYTLADPGEADALRACITEAFTVLSDPGRRAAYDEQLRAAAAASPQVVVPPRPKPPAPAPTSSKPRKPRAPKRSAAAAPPASPGAGSWSTTGISFTWAPLPAAGVGWIPYGLPAVPAPVASSVPPAPAVTPAGPAGDAPRVEVAAAPAAPWREALDAGAAVSSPGTPVVPGVGSPMASDPGGVAAEVMSRFDGPVPAVAASGPSASPAAAAPVVSHAEDEGGAPSAPGTVDDADAPSVSRAARPAQFGVPGTEVSTPLRPGPVPSAPAPGVPHGEVISLPAAAVRSAEGDPVPPSVPAPVAAAEVSAVPQAEVMGAPAPVVAPEPEAGGPGLEAVAPPRPVHALAASNGQPPRPILADPNLRALRAIPAWPNTVEEAPPPGAHDPVTDAESELPLDTLSPEDLEELDPDELLELDPEPQVDARGEPVQQVMSFASAPASPPPPLPPRLERTVTPVQFRQLDTSWAFKAPGGSPPPSPSVRSPLVAPPTLAPPPPPRVAEPAPEPQRGASVPVAPPPSPAPPPAAGAPAILPVAPAPPSSPVLESAIMLSPAKAREVKQRPADFPPDTVFNGELLRKVRIAQGLSLDDIAARTRITRKTLENVEAERFGELPALVYLRGTLMSLSTTLGLDPLRVSKSYLDLVQAGRSAPKQR